MLNIASIKVKKIHISFIDEEFENEETNEKIDEAVNKTQIIKGITENLLKKKAENECFFQSQFPTVRPN